MARYSNYMRDLENEKHYPDMLHEKCEWRTLFPPASLERGQELLNGHRIDSDGYEWSGRRRVVRERKKWHVQVSNPPKRLGDSWEEAYFRCGCGKDWCAHMAAVMLEWELEHGPWEVWETEYEYKIRLEEEEMEELRKQRGKEARRIGEDPVPAIRAFAGRTGDGPVIFDLPKALEEYTTTPYAIHRMPEVLKEKKRSYGDEMEMVANREGKRTIRFRQHFYDRLDAEMVWGSLTQTRLILHHQWLKQLAGYGQAFYEGVNTREERAPLDEYDLAAISMVWDLADTAGEEKITDGKAREFFRLIRGIREKESQKEIRTVAEVPAKKEIVELLPRIVVEDGEPQLSIKIGVGNGRKYVLKDCYALIDAVKKEEVLTLGKRDSIDFSRMAIRGEDQPLYEFILQHRAKSFGGMYQIPLVRTSLDNFYDKVQGRQCELMDKTNNIRNQLVSVGHMNIRFVLQADRLSDARGAFLGVVVSGFVPVQIRGAAHRYVLNTTGLSRISKEEKKVLAPFLKVADAAGYFRFQVGKDSFPEFYYRVIPELLENPFVEFEDHCGQEAAEYLPPEPQFDFYVDLEEGLLTLRGTVHYEEDLYSLGYGQRQAASSGYRDRDQEERALAAIGDWFTAFDEEAGIFTRQVDDDLLYDFLTVGIAALEFYGRVHGSSAFLTRRVLPEPRVQLGVSVSEDGNLLDISVTSKDLTPEELMAVYQSYRKKKRFYRLRSGAFIDLTEDRQMREIDSFLGQMDLDAGQAIKKKATVPMYRALYVNRMLEEHDALVAGRDQTYRALIRSFKTVSEADYDVPYTLEGILRSYQEYGYKWLRTLEETGFGGILADEMGLGKTLQMITLFESARLDAADGADGPWDDAGDGARDGAEREARSVAAGGAGTSLVVCPASLVYNWEEEIHRFAPDLKTVVLAGTASQRKKLLADLSRAKPSGTDPSPVDVAITSYDLLKRDITRYEGLRFGICVLDEAQYIKNANAAVTKAVKLIRARHRFALTGTPIENRLSELWSIFDFLMPGFLYGRDAFEKHFERPIVKDHDRKAMTKLKAMTAPFILRRRKTEVLKDLPEKLEEVRYARLQGEQQKLYDAQVVRMKGMLTDRDPAGEEKIRIFAELTRIRQICCDPSLCFEDYRGESAKREAVKDLIRSAMEGGHRMLIFSQFVTMLELLEEDLKKEKIPYYKIIGSTPKEKRVVMAREFNEGDVPVFLVSLKAGGTGLNLTGADMVIHYDPWWNLAAQNQATDRAHRIGQDKQVTVYRMILKDTIEERILQLQDAKRDLAEAILEGDRQSLFTLSAEELMDLLG